MVVQTENVDPNLKALRELLPENGRNIPDEFILEVLKNNGNDLNRAYEDLQQRLERASWESVEEKSKKKKGEKQQSDHTYSTASAAPRGRGRGRDNFARGDSTRPAGGGFSSGRDSGFSGRDSGFSGGAGNRGGRGGGAARDAGRTGGKPAEAPAVNRAVDGADKKPAQPAAAQERAIPEPAPVPASNQWAKGKPKIEYPQEKVVPPPPAPVQQQHPPPPIAVPAVAAPQPAIGSPQEQPQAQPPIQQLPSPLQAPAPQPQPAAANNEILAPIDQSPVASGSWGSGQVESAAASNIKVPMHTANGGGSALQTHAPAHAAPVVGPSGGNRSAEAMDKSQEGRFRERAAAPTASETDNLRNNFASLNVGQQTKIDAAAPAQQAAATAATMQTNTPLAFSAPATDTQQMPYSMPAQAGASGYGQGYPQYAPQYTQQFPMQANYAQGQDGEDFNAAGRMPGMGIGESGYAMSGGDAGVAQRGNSGNYGGKGAHGKQVQQPQQQPGMGMQQWQQGPLLNQYPGMMSGAAAAMYSQYAMAGIPTAQQMMYMQSYMGLPYAPGAIPGQMYNNTSGYPAQQNAGIASKPPYNAQNSNKKQQQYGNYPAAGYGNPQYSQPEAASGASQDFYKSQGAPAAAFQGNYGFNYTGAPMSVPYDSMGAFQGGQQQGSQAYAGRGSALAAGANGSGGAVDNSGMSYYPAFYPSQTDDSQGQQQWRATGRDRGQV